MKFYISLFDNVLVEQQTYNGSQHYFWYNFKENVSKTCLDELKLFQYSILDTHLDRLKISIWYSITDMFWNERLRLIAETLICNLLTKKWMNLILFKKRLATNSSVYNQKYL